MKAAVWHGRDDVRIEEVAEAPDPGMGEVRVTVDWCGICGTDVEEWRQGPIIIPTKPHLLTGMAAPLILGHEVVGRVESAGPGVSGLFAGALVALDAVLSCGSCWWCRRHLVTLCPNFAAIGLHRHGGLAERVTVPAAMCVSVPDGVDPAAAALAEPLAVAVRGLRKGRLAFGESVGIFGAGTIGLLTLIAAKHSGAGQVIVFDPVPARRQLAEQLGADLVFDPTDASFRDAARDATEGRGPDVTVEAAGSPRSAASAIDVTRAGGRTVIVGLTSTPAALDLLDIAAGEKEVIGSMSHVCDEEFSAAVQLLARAGVKADDLVERRIGLDDVVSVGFATLVAGATKPKVLVSPRL